jgi:hypothetical protein
MAQQQPMTPADPVAYDKHCRGIQESLAPGAGMEADLVQSIKADPIVSKAPPLCRLNRKKTREAHPFPAPNPRSPAIIEE